MIGLLVLLGAAAVGFGLAHALRLPATPFLLATGFALGAAGLLPETEFLETVLVLGASFLLFTAGAELDLGRVGRFRRAALVVGLAQFAVLGGLALALALGVGFGLEAALYLALALAASSTLVVVRLLQQRRQLFEPFGRLVTGVLLLQDLLLIVLAPMLIRWPAGTVAVGTGLVFTLALIGLAFALQRWVLPVLVLRWHLDGEALLLTTLGVLFGFMGLTVLFDLPIIVGAFLAGFSLSRFPVGGLVREQLNPVTDFFLPIFFTVLGGFILVPSLGALAVGLGFAVIVLVATPLVVTVVAERMGFSARSAIESGLLLAQTSELSLIIGLLALTEGAIGAEVFSAIVLVTAGTMIATPFLSTDTVTWRLLDFHPFHAPDKPEERFGDHILLLGCGDSGMPLLETLFLAGYEVLVVDDDPVIVRRLLDEGVPALRGDASDEAVLIAAGASQARAVIAMVRRPTDLNQLMTRCKRVPVFVRVFTDEDAAWVEKRGARPVRYAEAAADAFAEWFEAGRPDAPIPPVPPAPSE